MKPLFFASIAMVVLAGLAMTTITQANDSVTITATSNVQVISLEVADGNVDYGPLAPGQVKDTFDLNDTQTVTNTGTIMENFLIRGKDSQNWKLSFSQGLDQYVHAYSKDGVTFISMTTNNSALRQGVQPGESQPLHLRIKAPTESSSPAQQDVSVVLSAVAF